MEADKVVIIVKNSQNQFFVHQRSETKRTFPLKYGLGAGGHVDPGETHQQAARRELEEELNIIAVPQFLFSISFSSDEVTHVLHIYLVEYNGTPSYCTEFAWSGWLTVDKVDALANNNKLCPDTKEIYLKYKNLN